MDEATADDAPPPKRWKVSLKNMPELTITAESEKEAAAMYAAKLKLTTPARPVVKPVEE